jgi:hypothetical protein
LRFNCNQIHRTLSELPGPVRMGCFLYIVHLSRYKQGARPPNDIQVVIYGVIHSQAQDFLRRYHMFGGHMLRREWMPCGLEISFPKQTRVACDLISPSFLQPLPAIAFRMSIAMLHSFISISCLLCHYLKLSFNQQQLRNPQLQSQTRDAPLRMPPDALSTRDGSASLALLPRSTRKPSI